MTNLSIVFANLFISLDLKNTFNIFLKLPTPPDSIDGAPIEPIVPVEVKEVQTLAPDTSAVETATVVAADAPTQVTTVSLLKSFRKVKKEEDPSTGNGNSDKENKVS